MAETWANLSTMLGLATDDALNEVRAVVARYAPEDCDDLGSLIFIGKSANFRRPIDRLSAEAAPTPPERGHGSPLG